MTVQNLGPLDWRIPIVTEDGRVTPEFQRRWAAQIANNSQIGEGVQLGSGPPASLPTPVDGAMYVDISSTPFTTYVASGGVWSSAGVASDDPTAVAGDIAINGTAETFMRSDAAPAVQKASTTQFGIVKVDGTTIDETGGVISVVGGGVTDFTDLGDVPSSYTGAERQALRVNPAETGLEFVENSYDIGMSIGGVPAISTIVAYAPCVTDFTLPAGLSGSQAYCLVQPSGPVIFDIEISTTKIGEVEFDVGSNEGVFTLASSQAFINTTPVQTLNLRSPADVKGIEGVVVVFKAFVT